MSLPITAVGPLNVLTKPIFTDFCWAEAGAAASRASAVVASRALFIAVSPRRVTGGDLSASLEGPKAPVPLHQVALLAYSDRGPINREIPIPASLRQRERARHA